VSLPIPLTVRLSTNLGTTPGIQDRIVTRELRDLQFRHVVPGGFASATMSLDRPLALQPSEIVYYGRVYIYDARTGLTVWEGQLEDPGRGAGQDGQVWQLTAIGPSGHVHDRTMPLVYVDRSLRAMVKVDNTKAGFDASITADPGDAAGLRQAIVLRLPQSLTVTSGDKAAMRYSVLSDSVTAQKLARVAYAWDAGRTDANWVVEAVARTDGSLASGDTAATAGMNTAGGNSAGVVVTNFTNGRNTIEFRLRQSGAGTGSAPDDTHWASFSGVVIRTMLKDAVGADITTGYTLNTVLASEVIADLLGRLLTRFDGAGAVIATTTFAIEQLAYPDSADPGKVLDDLMTLEPAYYWAAWESTSTGRHRFEWTAWPTSVRYEASVTDGFTSPGSADGLYNAVRVRYVDATGAVRTVQRTTTVAVLAAAGLTREGFLDLGSEAGTLADAQQAGDRWLEDRATPPNAGTLTIARPILDRVDGRMVQPWEIRAGNLIRVRGVLPRVDALNATARDGVTVFRIIGHTYRASTAAAELDLDSYGPSVARALADVSRQPNTWRR
jgi:hypothetical protein